MNTTATRCDCGSCRASILVKWFERGPDSRRRNCFSTLVSTRCVSATASSRSSRFAAASRRAQRTPVDVHQMFRHSREYRWWLRLDTPETQTFPLTRAARSVRHRVAPSKRWRHQNSRPQSDRVSKRGHVRHHGAKAPDELHKGMATPSPERQHRADRPRRRVGLFGGRPRRRRFRERSRKDLDWRSGRRGRRDFPSCHGRGACLIVHESR